MQIICSLLACITVLVNLSLPVQATKEYLGETWADAFDDQLVVPVILNPSLAIPGHPLNEDPPPVDDTPVTPPVRDIATVTAVDVMQPRAFLPIVAVAPEDWLNISNRQVARDFYLANFTSSVVALGWTGNYAACSAGSTSVDFRNAVLSRINSFRAMAGVPAHIVFTNEYNTKTLAAALMMSRNTALSHSPPASWRCYTSNGSAGAANSNLTLGINGNPAINGYMKDAGSNNAPVGHRRWILYPQTRDMGTGDTPAVGTYRAANALWVLDSHTWDPRPQTRDTFVAWPPPGFIPYQIVYPRWSFSLAEADFASASVTMSSGGKSVQVTRASVVTGYGENTLVWIPLGLSDGAVWPVPSQDTTYQVAISNVKVAGQTRSFNYDVTVFVP
jgi:hypothetical protein